MSDDIKGNKKISQFPSMPDPSTLYMGELLGNYKRYEGDSWHTGTIPLSEIGGGGGDPEEYLRNLPDMTSEVTAYNQTKLLLHPTYNWSYEDPYIWADMESVVSVYLSALSTISHIDQVDAVYLYGDINDGPPGKFYFEDLVESIVHNRLPYTDEAYGRVWLCGDQYNYSADLSACVLNYIRDNAYEVYSAISEYLN